MGPLWSTVPTQFALYVSVVTVDDNLTGAQTELVDYFLTSCIHR